jgi:hypothetical protein
MQVGNEIRGSFNHDITLLTGTVKLYKANVLFLTFTQADITVVTNSFSIDVTGMLTGIGEYRVEVSAGLFKDDISLNKAEQWEFTIAEGEYSNTDYDTAQYLTN